MADRQNSEFKFCRVLSIIHFVLFVLFSAYNSNSKVHFTIFSKKIISAPKSLCNLCFKEAKTVSERNKELVVPNPYGNLNLAYGWRQPVTSAPWVVVEGGFIPILSALCKGVYALANRLATYDAGYKNQWWQLASLPKFRGTTAGVSMK